jgi:hypothetical protein
MLEIVCNLECVTYYQNNCSNIIEYGLLLWPSFNTGIESEYRLVYYIHCAGCYLHAVIIVYECSGAGDHAMTLS